MIGQDCKAGPGRQGQLRDVASAFIATPRELLYNTVYQTLLATQYITRVDADLVLTSFIRRSYNIAYRVRQNKEFFRCYLGNGLAFLSEILTYSFYNMFYC